MNPRPRWEQSEHRGEGPADTWHGELPSARTVRRRARGHAPLAAVTLTLLCSAARVATAEPIGADPKKAAAALHDEAIRLEHAGHYDKACPKLEEAVKRQPNRIAPAFEVARCWETAGKFLRAQAAYRAAGAVARRMDDDRGDEADEKVQELTARIPKLRLVVPPSLRELSGLAVERDGVRVEPSEWGTDVAVEPGSHVIAVSAKHTPGRRKLVVLAPNDAVTSFEVPSPSADEKEPNAPPDATSSLPLWPLLAGTTGVLLMGVGVGFGVDGLVAKGHLSKQCFDDHTCPPGVDPTSLNDRKDRGLAVFTAAGGAGLVVLGVAIIGAATSKKPAPAARVTGLCVKPLLGRTTAGITLEGATW